MKKLIEMAISNYNSRPTIRVQNMINKLTKRKVPEINSKTVFNASEILESTLTEGKYIIDPNKERINPDKEEINSDKER